MIWHVRAQARRACFTVHRAVDGSASLSVRRGRNASPPRLRGRASLAPRLLVRPCGPFCATLSKSPRKPKRRFSACACALGRVCARCDIYPPLKTAGCYKINTTLCYIYIYHYQNIAIGLYEFSDTSRVHRMTDSGSRESLLSPLSSPVRSPDERRAARDGRRTRRRGRDGRRSRQRRDGRDRRRGGPTRATGRADK